MHKAVIVALIGGGLAIGGTAIASAGEIGTANPDGVSQNGPALKDPAQAADMVIREAGGGRVVKAEQAQVDGKTVYKITFRTSDGTRTVTVDPFSGAMSGMPPVQPGPSSFPGQGRQQGQEQGQGQPSQGDYQYSWDFGGNAQPSRAGVTPSK